MRKTSNLLLAALLVVAASVGFTSCKKDDPKVEILSPVAGDYNGEEDCTPGAEYQVHVYNTADRPGVVFVDNPFDIGERFEANVNGNSLTIIPREIEVPDFDPSVDTTYVSRFSGSGTVNGDILTLDFKLDIVTGADTTNFYAGECKFTGNRAFRLPAVGNGG